MARIPLPKVSDLTEAQRKQYDRFPSNLALALLQTTDSTSGYLSLGASFPAGKLSDKDREMAILRIGAMSKSAYERMQHLSMARRAGWSDQDIANIEKGVGDNARDKTILRYVEECVENVKVSDSAFAAVKEIYSNTQIAELTLLVGHYMMTARFVETLEVDLDKQATSWGNMSVS